MKKLSIGGQALLEGVMMQGPTSMAVAVRDPEGVIRLKTERLNLAKNIFYKIPVVRGVFYFVRSLVTGIKTITDSARILTDETDKTEKSDKNGKKEKSGDSSWMLFFAVVFGLALSIGLFILLPKFLTDLFFGTPRYPILKNITEGVVKIAIFVGYLVAVGFMKDIKRTFMYHGAEHRTINAYEKGLALTVENVQKMPTFHPRCGTSFMFFVLAVSIIIYSLFPDKGMLLNLVFRLAGLPVVAGLSYELLKLLAKSDSKWLVPFKAPGYLLQKLSTRIPDDSMAEVALAAFKRVLEMEEDQSIPGEDFFTAQTLREVREMINRAYEEAGVDKSGDIDWILTDALGVKTAELQGDMRVTGEKLDKIKKIIEQRKSGEPLQYIVGYTEFYGFRLKVTPAVLIPRPETEQLAEEALKYVSAGAAVLDLCTGSGAIAVTVAKQSHACVFASDVSAEALAVARENADANSAHVEFIESDMFQKIERKFDIIISNPPYIPSAEIDGLQMEVKNFEPRGALDGGADGLDFYRAIAAGAKQHLEESGRLFLEIGFGQAESVKQILAEAGFKYIEIKKDFENIDRIITAVC